jgi:hypothetical protein
MHSGICNSKTEFSCLARLEDKNPHGRYFLTAAFASILLILGMSASEVFAMGQAPSTCPNRYDATITEMILNNGTHTFDPIQNPDMAFRAEARAGYFITMTLRTANQSTDDNQENGTTWYRDNIFGYGNGHCVYDVGPNEDKALSLAHRWNFAGLGPPRTQNINWSTFLNSVTYNVSWYDEFAPRDLSATAVSASQIDLSWSAPLNDGGSQITGYRIDRTTNGGATWSAIVSNTNSTSTAHSDTGLSPSTTYDYRVFAITSSGTSPVSNYARATTFNEEILPPTLVNLSVNSADMSETAFEEMWVELWQDGSIMQEGPTPFAVKVKSGDYYEVFMGNWENIIFDHWEDGSTDAQRAFVITEDTALTAYFETNSPPGAGDDDAETTISTPVTIDVLANDSDPDYDSLSVDSITIQPMHGTVTINPDNTITYTPDLAFVGSDSFDYQVSDGNCGTDTALVSITIGVVAIPTIK